MKRYMVGLLVFVSAGVNADYLSQSRLNPYDLLARVVAPFQAGYGYTQEQKDVARKHILELKKEYAAIKNSSGFFENEDELQKIKDKIRALQIVTGDEWSKQRKMVLGAIALLGTSALAFGIYQYVHKELVVIDQVNVPEINVSEVNAPGIEDVGPNILEQASGLQGQSVVESLPGVLGDNLSLESPELKQVVVPLKSSEEAQIFLKNLFRGI